MGVLGTICFLLKTLVSASKDSITSLTSLLVGFFKSSKSPRVCDGEVMLVNFVGGLGVRLVYLAHFISKVFFTKFQEQ